MQSSQGGTSQSQNPQVVLSIGFRELPEDGTLIRVKSKQRRCGGTSSDPGLEPDLLGVSELWFSSLRGKCG